MATYLDRIVAAHREAAAADHRDIGELVAHAERQAPTRRFEASLRATAEGGRLAMIAEIKRRSPSKGALKPGLDPGRMAQRYEAGGASALSVLTDVEFFGGSPQDLQRARDACSLPVLRKDFTVAQQDVADVWLMGADCVLLIVAALAPVEVVELHALAGAIGLDVLVEIHDEHELAVALDAGATLIGVNQRDLVTFEVDTDRAVRMAPLIPEHVVKVAESGVRTPAQADALRAAGYHAVLVGEGVVTADDPAATVRALTGGA